MIRQEQFSTKCRRRIVQSYLKRKIPVENRYDLYYNRGSGIKPLRSKQNSSPPAFPLMTDAGIFSDGVQHGLSATSTGFGGGPFPG